MPENSLRDSQNAGASLSPMSMLGMLSGIKSSYMSRKVGAEENKVGDHKNILKIDSGHQSIIPNKFLDNTGRSALLLVGK